MGSARWFVTLEKGFLILGGSAIPGRESLRYRGVYRANPSFQQGLSAEHPVNRAFGWFCEEGGQSGTVSDIRRARELLGLYRNLSPPQVFEIIEPVPLGSNPTFPSEFLGWDMAAGGIGFSLLSSEFRPPKAEPKGGSAAALMNLVEAHFKPKLNASGLFDRHED